MAESEKKKVETLVKTKKTDNEPVGKAEYTPEERALIDEYECISKSTLKPLKYKTVKIEGNNVEIGCSIDPQKKDLMDPTLAKTTGTHQLYFAKAILGKTGDAIRDNILDGKRLEEQLNSVSAAMMDLEPKDGFEGMLISQMVAVYHHAMECFRVVNIDSNKSSIENRATLYNQGNKLMRTYVAQMEALKKYRTGGQQKMIVEHIHVNEGGQAVIGNVSKGGGDDKKK